MALDIKSLIGEATAYDKKQMLEIKRPKSWLKSVSAFANGEGGTLIFGISDDDQIIGLEDAESDAEKISEEIKTKLDPVPVVNLEYKEIDGKRLILLHVYSGQETPYYYIGDKQRLAFVRIGNESVTADRIQLKTLVLKGSGRTYDSLPSNYRQRSFDDSEFVSWGIVDENGNLTNAGALLADESPVRQSRIFCTRWNGLDMTSGLGEAIDDVELEGCVIGQLQDAVSFVRNNSHKKWWKENDYREELPDYPERAVTEAIANAIIHRDYLQMGSEIHIDMYDDRLEIYSPGGMMDGRLIQQLNPLTVPSKRRNPLLADFFSRLGLMERRGNFHAPEFHSNASEFHVILWNLNYEDKSGVRNDANCIDEFVNENEQFANQQNEFANNGEQFVKSRKEFLKASRMIYNLISANPRITTAQMAEKLKLSQRQVQKYLKRLQETEKISRSGTRKNSEWKIIDNEYEGFFDRI